MIFESKDFYVGTAGVDDIDKLVQIYNSNEEFLRSHIGRSHVTAGWMSGEIASMSEARFCSCKIIEKSSGTAIGLMDFKVGKESYLSLLMIHNNYRVRGVGKQILKAFERYVQLQGSKSIRIDVVSSYDCRVFDFWEGNGFAKYGDVDLEWAGKTLSAVVMKNNV